MANQAIANVAQFGSAFEGVEGDFFANFEEMTSGAMDSLQESLTGAAMIIAGPGMGMPPGGQAGMPGGDMGMGGMPGGDMGMGGMPGGDMGMGMPDGAPMDEYVGGPMDGMGAMGGFDMSGFGSFAGMDMFQSMFADMESTFDVVDEAMPAPPPPPEDIYEGEILEYEFVFNKNNRMEDQKIIEIKGLHAPSIRNRMFKRKQH